MRNKKITGKNMKTDLISLLEDEEEEFPSFDELNQGDEPQEDDQ